MGTSSRDLSFMSCFGVGQTAIPPCQNASIKLLASVAQCRGSEGIQASVPGLFVAHDWFDDSVWLQGAGATCSTLDSSQDLLESVCSYLSWCAAIHVVRHIVHQCLALEGCREPRQLAMHSSLWVLNLMSEFITSLFCQ